MGSSSLDKERRRKGSLKSHMLTLRVEEVDKPRVELALDSIGRQFVEQDRTQDFYDVTYTQLPDFLFVFYYLHLI